MSTVLHLIFEIFKIALLASAYTLIILFLFRQIGKSNPDNWFQRSTKNRKRFLSTTRTIVSVGLFAWMFTYWGSHGLGDSARIPIGHGKEIEQMNGTWSFISPNRHEFENFSIHSFAVKGNYCSGKTSPASKDYFIWDLNTNEVQTVNAQIYQDLSQKMGLASEYDFVTFSDEYRRFWGGWRFWLLP